MVVVCSQCELLEIVLTSHPRCGHADLLNGRQQKTHQYCDNCNRHHQLDECEAASPALSQSRHWASLPKGHSEFSSDLSLLLECRDFQTFTVASRPEDAIQITLRTECHVPNPIAVPSQRCDLLAAQPPHLYCRVGATPGEQLSIRAEGDTIRAAAGIANLIDNLPCFGVPDTNDSVPADGGQSSTIRTEVHSRCAEVVQR